MSKRPKVLISLLLVSLNVLLADVGLNSLFSDHMVIQQNTTIPVWGWANPQEKIEITTSWGEKVEAVTAQDSTWRVSLKTPSAGGPFRMIVSGDNTIVIDDILSGEVWLCTGQSNMDFAVGKFINDAREEKYQPLVEYIRKEVATANDPWLRNIEVSQETSIFKKKKNFDGKWVSVNPKDIKKITATGYFFAKELRKYLNVPVGIIECSWGGTRIQPWLSEEAYQSDAELKAYFDQGRARIRKELAELGPADEYVDTSYEGRYKAWVDGGKTTNRPYPKKYPTEDNQIEATLYNGMLSTVMPYGIKGVIWYQGESNSHYLEEEYEKYFKLMIQSWRKEWGQGDFSFYWAQLAAYRVNDKRSDLGWAMVNDHLRRGLDLPHTGMAVLYDIGEAKDVHPHNKMEAGKRLSLWALKQDYGINIPVISGPLYKRAKVEHNAMVVEFTSTGSGLMVGSKELMYDTERSLAPLSSFQIKGADGIWKEASADIITDKSIKVYSPEVAHPLAVRYAWSSNPENANLYNCEGLPAAVFTTEE